MSLFASGSALKSSSLPRLAVDANLNFGVLGVGQTRKLPFLLMNLGNFDLTITSIKRTEGSSSFEIVPAVVTPITVLAGDKMLLTMQFESGHPLGFSGDREAKFEIASNDNRSPYALNVTGYGPTNVALTVVLVVIGIAAVVGAGIGVKALKDKLSK